MIFIQHIHNLLLQFWASLFCWLYLSKEIDASVKVIPWKQRWEQENKWEPTQIQAISQRICTQSEFSQVCKLSQSSFHEHCVNKLYRMQSIPYGTASCLLPRWDYLGSPNNRVQTSNSWKIQQSGLTWDALSPHSQCSIRRLCLAGGLSVGTLICKGTMKGLVNFHPVSNAVKIFSGLQSFCQREVIWHGTAERVGRPSS